MDWGRGNFIDLISYKHNESSFSGGSQIISMKTLYIIQIYIYTPNLGSGISFFNWERE